MEEKENKEPEVEITEALQKTWQDIQPTIHEGTGWILAGVRSTARVVTIAAMEVISAAYSGYRDARKEKKPGGKGDGGAP